MKNSFIKALGLMLALMLVLTGCNLIEVDPEMQADEDIAKLRTKYADTVASWDSGAITTADVLAAFDSAYSNQYYNYAYFGLQLDDASVRSIIDDTLTDRVRAEITAAHFDAENALTQEELDALNETVTAEQEELRASALESAEGKTAKQKNANVRVMLCEIGREFDTDYKTHLLEEKREKMETLLSDTIADVSDEDLEAAYVSRVEEDEASYASNTAALESALTSGNTVYWMPEGYRTVKHILIQPQDELLSAYTDAKSRRDVAEDNIEDLALELDNYDAETAGERSQDDIRAEIEAAQAELDTLKEEIAAAAQVCLDDVKPTTDAIYAALVAGMNFDDAIAQYGQDPGMQNEPTMTTGYYVCANSANWQQEFTDGAMALGEVGAYSEAPVLSGSGVHIILYASDVPSGEIGLENVRDALYNEVLTEKKDAYVTETIDGWVEAEHPVYNADVFHKVFFED